jgi:hypothetical protein
MGWTISAVFHDRFSGRTLEDVQGIVDLCRQIKGIGKAWLEGRLKIPHFC